MSTQTQERTRYQRIEENCKSIWGPDEEFDISDETDVSRLAWCEVSTISVYVHIVVYRGVNALLHTC